MQRIKLIVTCRGSLKMKHKHLLSLVFGVLIAFASLNAQSQSLPPKPQLMADLITHELNLKEPAVLRSSRIIERTENTDWAQVELAHPKAGQIRILMKGPIGFWQSTQKSYRSILVVSGFFTGQESLRFMGDFPNTVLIGFQYPYSLEDIQNNPFNFIQLIRQTSGQIALAEQWIQKQSWVDNTKSTAVGVSLGGIFLPSALYLSERLDAKISHVALVCTGAHITPIIEAQMAPYIGRSEAQMLAWAMANVSSMHDPKLYLPELKADFLVLHADQDEVISSSSGHLIEKLLPQSKVEMMHGQHINTERLDMIEQTKAAILRWLNLN